MTKLNVYQRVNKVMSELSYLKKTATVGSGSYGYTALSHDHVTQSIQPLMVKYGLVAETSMVCSEFNRYSVKTRKGDNQDRYETSCTAQVWIVNMDVPDERFMVTASAHGFDPQDKSPGKAYSMAVKYCLLKTFMVASGDQEEERVEAALLVNNERDKLESELCDILTMKKKLNDTSIAYMKSLDINGLRDAIERNKGE